MYHFTLIESKADQEDIVNNLQHSGFSLLKIQTLVRALKLIGETYYRRHGGSRSLYSYFSQVRHGNKPIAAKLSLLNIPEFTNSLEITATSSSVLLEVPDQNLEKNVLNDVIQHYNQFEEVGTLLKEIHAILCLYFPELKVITERKSVRVYDACVSPLGEEEEVSSNEVREYYELKIENYRSLLREFYKQRYGIEPPVVLRSDFSSESDGDEDVFLDSDTANFTKIQNNDKDKDITLRDSFKTVALETNESNGVPASKNNSNWMNPFGWFGNTKKSIENFGHHNKL